MKGRPVAITIIAIVYILTGAGGMLLRSNEARMNAAKGQPFETDLVWIFLVSLAAVVFGIYLLRGSNWARWGAVAWMAFHVVVSAFESPMQAAAHTAFLAVAAWFLFRPKANEYFRGNA